MKVRFRTHPLQQWLLIARFDEYLNRLTVECAQAHPSQFKLVAVLQSTLRDRWGN